MFSIGLILQGERKRKHLGYILFIWKRFSPKMLLEIIPLAVFVLAVGVSLAYFVPVLRWGWLGLIDGRINTIYAAPIAMAADSINLFPHLFLIAFLVGLLLIFPFAARSEEYDFRKGRHSWKEIVPQSIKFGLGHLVIGIPISFAVALIIGGLFFAYKYKSSFERYRLNQAEDKAEEEALLVSTVYHAMFNSLLISLLLVVEILVLVTTIL